MSEFAVLNTRAPRIDAPSKATGRGKYAEDLSMPGMLYAALLQSPVAHARSFSGSIR
jgi:CO/xanthine dehydrogenase Mo-binding subunit